MRTATTTTTKKPFINNRVSENTYLKEKVSFRRRLKPRAETVTATMTQSPSSERGNKKLHARREKKKKVDIKHASQFSPFHDSESQMKIPS